MHKLLDSQIRRCLGDAVEPSPGLDRLLDAVSAAYQAADADRAQLERSLDLKSEELMQRSEELRADLAHRTRTAAELRRTLSILQATLDSTTDGIVVVDTEGRIATFNRRLLEMWRLPRQVLEKGDAESALQYVVDQLAEPGPFVARSRALLGDTESESFDVIELADGRIFERYSQPHRVHGMSAGRVFCFRDVTERRRIEGELRQSQKLEAVGKLAGGIAHDFNNLLTAISGYSELLALELEGQPEYQEQLGEIRKAAQRAADLTRQLLAFSRRQALAPVELNLNAVVGSIDRMLRRLLGEHIAIRLDCGLELGAIRADLSQIEQILVNLAVNARDAMGASGTLAIETRNLTANDPELKHRADWLPDGYVLLRVSDTGCGMDQELQKRAFEPFFTTKELGKGTGLGLSTVFGIVMQSGGAIWLESEPGHGTTFSIVFPRVPHAGDAPDPATDVQAPAPTALETVLLAEDDATVRRLASAILRRCGYTVLEAPTGDEALRTCERHPAPIHLLLTDVVMPGLSGFELGRAVSRLRPETRIVYTSGYAQAGGLPPVLEKDVHFLPKPFSSKELESLVRKVLDSPPATRR